ncbi:hypothetical protein CfE428DRAFT_3638 [Chthoniobacter flavus Ellin428]|uniref:Uncharacterized protein n=1 Tax=Chthoniobacter flavus Ellin428 TaxID=497964 RepID=B4D400_9BACT|nr:hypothetical protein CfE428DRAFT_3638 [Chthoniobacter flavus Ellin428]
MIALNTAHSDTWRNMGNASRQPERCVDAASARPTVKVLMFCVRTMKTCISSPSPGKARDMSGMP